MRHRPTRPIARSAIPSTVRQATLLALIAACALDRSEPTGIVRAEPPGSRAADPTLWSLQPLRDPTVPATPNENLHPIDAFLRKPRAQRGLTPRPAADRRSLIRRLSFDLTGLPPDPKDVEDFANDSDPEAYDRLVDRLLDSPHHGERWARHWMDLIRWGESQGFELDKLRPNAWRYRDWLIDAVNRDMPYDQFLRLQIAGDLLDPGNPSAVVATGFLSAGPWDEVGQTQQSPTMRAQVRQDAIESLVAMLSQTVLGLSVHCARCHDHPHDAIPQADYYRFAALLEGVHPGDRTLVPLADDTVLADARRLVHESAARLRGFEEPYRQRRLAERAHSTVPTPAPILAWRANADTKTSKKEPIIQVSATAGTVAAGTGWERVDHAEPIPRRLVARTVDIVLEPADDPSSAASVAIESVDGRSGERIGRRGESLVVLTYAADGVADLNIPLSAVRKTTRLTLVFRADFTVNAFLDGQPAGKPATLSDLKSHRPGNGRLQIGTLRDGTIKGLPGRVAEVNVFDQSLSSEQVAGLAGTAVDDLRPEDLLAQLSPNQARRYRDLVIEASRCEHHQLGLIEGGEAFGVVPVKPGRTRVLRRGDVRHPGDAVTPAGLSMITSVSRDFGLSEDASDADRRIALANYLTDRRQVLAWRVIVNRLWQQHFGTGLVPTANDFGTSGETPTHPELCDWLAGELVRTGFSLKHLHRTIVTSAAYQQDSGQAAAGTDAGNRFLLHMPRRRLDAEMLRDAMLVVSGQGNPAMGGPGYRDFVTTTRKSQLHEPADVEGFAVHRRSIYRTWARSGTNPLLDAFDAPNPSTICCQRVVTCTPTQSLVLWNDPFVLRMADAFARRLEREAGTEADRQVALAYQLAFARPPDSVELKQAIEFLATQPLASFCRVLFNSSEFQIID